MLFMSDFFKKSDLSRNEAEDIVSDTLNKCDDGELYLEDSKSESILLDDNKIKNSSYSSDLGFGLRAISDEIVAFVDEKIEQRLGLGDFDGLRCFW